NEDGEVDEIRAAEVTLDVDLLREQGAGGTFSGRANAFVVLRVPGESPRSDYGTLPVDLTLAPAAGGGTLTACFFPEEDSRLSLTATWSPRPTTVEVEGTFEEMGDGAMVTRGEGTARAIENADVLKSGNAWHERAVGALTELQTLLDEPGFRAAAEDRLFAPDRQVLTASQVTATRDWVLFQRRRDNSCDCSCAFDGTKVLRRYRVYHAQAPAGLTVGQIRDAVKGTSAIEGLATVPVVPRFAADDVSLLTLPREVLDAWKAMDLGSEIVYGAVAPAGVGTVDAGALLDGRLESFGAVVDDVTPDPRAVYEVLASVPPTLDAGGLDGVMVLVTQATRRPTVCHAVYSLPDPGSIRRVTEAVRSGEGLGALLEECILLESPTFAQGTGTPDPAGSLDNLKKKWDDQWPGYMVGQSITIAHNTSTVPAGAEAQATAINTRVGTGLPAGRVFTTGEKLAIPCPVITVLEPKGVVNEPGTVCHGLYRLKPGWTMPLLGEVVAEGNLAERLDEIAWELGTFDFTAGTSTPESDLSGLKAAWAALAHRPPEFGATFSTEQPGSAAFLVQSQQGMVLNQACGGPAHANEWHTDQPISQMCDVVTLLAEQPGAPAVHHVYRVMDRYHDLDGDTTWQFMHRKIQQEGDLQGALELYPDDVDYLGEVIFYDGMPTIRSGNPAAWWSAAGGGPVISVGDVSYASWPGTWKTIAQNQSAVIANTAAGSFQFTDNLEVPDRIDGTDAVTFLVTIPLDLAGGPQTDCASAYVLDPKTSDSIRQQLDIDTAMDGAGMFAFVEKGPVPVKFTSGTTKLVTQASEIVKTLGTTLVGNVTVVPQGTSPTDAKRAIARSMQVASIAGSGDAGEALGPVFSSEPIPGGCASATLLLRSFNSLPAGSNT
ncbi:MAG TPA: hypothetical protein VJT67_17430, partial [Longimicrobiaceae bacterium]|nr:hypothetical protein [Longimicrobiaceae bacterium]